jgi:cell division septation protein DedD
LIWALLSGSKEPKIYEGYLLWVLGMVDKKTEDKKEKDPFADSSEIFESIFKEATQEIGTETGKVAAKPAVKPKPKPEPRAKPEPRPKAPTKLELEAEPELIVEPEQKPRSDLKPRLQPPIFKSRQEPIRKPITRTPGPREEEGRAGVVAVGPLVRSRIQEQKPKEEQGRKAGKAKAPKKKGKGSPVLKIILLLLLLAAGVGGASVYFGIIDVSDYFGRPEPATKEAPKVAVSKTPPAQPAAKPPQPAPPKAAQPSQPQAKPAEAPKPAAQPQTVQPPQAPPKPAEGVKPPPPPPPSEVQAKPATPAPPAVAKAETPTPPVQPPVKSQPQVAPAPVQPPVKSEPKAPPAPVQPPAVPKKAEAPQTAVPPKEVAAAKTVPPVSGSGVSYPYSVYLGSFQNLEYVKKALSVYENQGLLPYWTKVELGEKGTWYRIFTGYFRSAQEAEAFIQQRKIKEGEVKETRYSNLIGTFGTKQDGEEKALGLARTGLSAYWIQGSDGQVRLYSGAFITKEGAEKNQAELNARGIKSQIAER